MDVSSRRYPPRPIAGVGAVIFDGAGRLVLVRRGGEPSSGEWSLPGGALEIGETLAEGVAREVIEETGLIVDVGPVVDAFDRIVRDGDGRVEYHYVVVDFLCRVRGGVLSASTDALDAVYADPRMLGTFHLTDTTHRVIRRALDLL